MPKLILITIIGIIILFVITSTFSFKDKLFSTLYNKPQSLAIGPTDFIDEQPGWVTSCNTFTDIPTPYPSTACPPNTITTDSSVKKIGNYSTVIQGKKDQQTSYSKNITGLQPSTKYKIGFWIKYKDRTIYNFLNLNYPSAYATGSFLNNSHGIWSGEYFVQLKLQKTGTQTYTSVVNLLPSVWPYDYSYQELPWYYEEQYLQTGSSQTSTDLNILLKGFDGKLLINGITLEQVNTIIDDKYFHMHAPIYQGMNIKTVSTSPLSVETNAAKFSFNGDVITMIKTPSNTEVGRLAFPSSFLSGLTLTQEQGNTVFLKNDKIQLSIGADSVLLAKLIPPSPPTTPVIKQITVSGPRPSYHAFEAGVIFTTDNQEGVLFSPIRSSTDIATMRYSPNPKNNDKIYNDNDFTANGTKFWDTTSDFTNSWTVNYNFLQGDGFLAQVFPPKEFDSKKYFKERAGVITADTVPTDPPVAQTDFLYNIQKFKDRANIGFSLINYYAKSKNNLNPPDFYCTDKNTQQYIYCDLNDTDPNHIKHYAFNKNAVAGPFEPANPPKFTKFVNQAHSAGLKIIVYTSPLYYYTSNVDTFLANVKNLINTYNLDGIYYDGLYTGDALKSLELVRKTRVLLGGKFYLQHDSINQYLITNTTHFKPPFLDAYADQVWVGEGSKLADDDMFRLNYAGKNISNTVSSLLSEYRPVDYTKSPTENAAITWSPKQQIDTILNYQGAFKTDPYSEQSFINDSHFPGLPFSSSYFYNKLNQAGLTSPLSTCNTPGNGACNIGEDIFTCPQDCAPPSTESKITKSGNNYSCQSSGSVAQWSINSTPFYTLHFTFDGPIVHDDSGNKLNPSQYMDNPEYDRAPLPTVVDSNHVFSFGVSLNPQQFNGEYTASLFGLKDKKLSDTISHSISVFTRIKQTVTSPSYDNSKTLFKLSKTGVAPFILSLSRTNDLVIQAGGNTVVTNPADRINDTDWHTVGVIYDQARGSLTLYIDGVARKSATGINITFAAYGDYDVGINLKGYMDDLFVSDQVLTDQLISQYKPDQDLMKTFNTNQPNVACITADTTNGSEKYFTAVTVATAPKPGDINKDGVVNIIDYGIFVGDFGATSGVGLRSDINKDGVVNIIDYGIFVGNFGK